MEAEPKLVWGAENQGKQEGGESPGVSRVTGSENSPATALLQAFTRKFMNFMSNLRPGRREGGGITTQP